MREKIKNIVNLENLLKIYIIIQFGIDIITSLCIRNISENLSLGIFIRTAFLIIFVCYSFVKSDKKSKIKLLIFYGGLGVYLIAFLGVCYKSFGMNGIASQIKGALKTFYLPILLIAFLPILKKKEVKIGNNVFMYALLGYTGTIVLARIFNISYPSYPLYNGEGTVGLFYAANEIGVIMSILAPITVMELMNNEKRSVINFIAVIVLILASLEIGTKVPFISLILLICAVLYSCVVKIPNKVERKENIKKLIATLVTVVGILIILPFSPIAYNLGNAYNIAIPNVFSLGNKSTPTTEPNKNLQTKEEIQTAVYSSRNVYLSENLEKYKESNIMKKIFGIGYLNEQQETKEITELKLVEIDYYDIFICHGIIGSLVYLVPFIYLFVIFIRKIVSNIKLVLLNREYILREYSILIALFIAFTAGHVFTAPAPALFLTLCIVQYCKLFDEK